MGIIIKHNKSTSIIPIKSMKCKAHHITEVLSNGAWGGKTCFLIGGSPFLKDFDFSSIANELTIGVNKAFTKFPCTINYAMDTRFYDMVTQPVGTRFKELHQQWLKYKGIKLFMRRSAKVKFDTSVYFIDSLEKKALSLDLLKGIWGGNNSGFGALMLAVGLGATRIGLLGYSMKVQGKGKGIRTHWHGGYGLGREANFQSKLNKFRMCFEEFAPIIAQQGIKVTNLVEKGEDSKLTCFPKDSIENFLK